MKKFFLLLLLVTILNIDLYTSEICLKGMSGISKIGLLVIPDNWCDSFFINPAFLTESEKITINTNSNFRFSITYRNTKGFVNPPVNMDYNNKFIYFKFGLNPDINYGMIIPGDFFSLGFNINYNLYFTNFNGNEYYYHPIYGDLNYRYNQIINNNRIGGDVSFGFKLNQYLSLGFKTQVNSLFCYYNEYKMNDQVIRTPKREADVTINNATGLLLDLNIFKMSFSTPFSINYQKTESPEELEFNGYAGYRYNIESYSLYLGGNLLIDLNFNKYINLRFPLEAGINIHEYKMHLIEDEYLSSYPDEFNLDSENNYRLKDYLVPISTAISISHQIKDKVMLFYGIEMLFSSINNYDVNNNSYFFRQNISFDIAIFTGGEFYIHKTFLLRTGLSTYIFNSYYTLDMTGYYDKSTVKSLKPFINYNFELGFTIIPVEKVKIELNTNLVDFNFDNIFNNFDYLFISGYQNKTIKFEIDLGIIINLDKKIKKDN